MVGFQCYSAFTFDPEDWTFVDPLDDSCLITSWTAYKKCLALNTVMDRNLDTEKLCAVLDYYFVPSMAPNFTAQTITQNGIFFSFPRMVWSIYWWNDDYGNLAAINQLAKTLKGYQMYELEGGYGVSDTLSFNYYQEGTDTNAIWHFAYEDDDSSKYLHMLAAQTDYGSTVDTLRLDLLTDTSAIDGEHVKLDYLNFNSYERQVNEDDAEEFAWVTFLPSELDSVPLYMTELVDGDDYDLTIPLPKGVWTLISLNLYPGSFIIPTIFTDVEAGSLYVKDYLDRTMEREDGSWDPSVSYIWSMVQGYKVKTTDYQVFMPSLSVSDSWWFDPDIAITITPSSPRKDFFIAYTPCWDMLCSEGFEPLWTWGTPDTIVDYIANSAGDTFFPDSLVGSVDFMLRQGEGYHLKMLSTTNYSGFQFTDLDSTGVVQLLDRVQGKAGGNNSQIASVTSSHFEFRKQTQYLYPIVLENIDIEGVVSEQGDEIGVFMWDTLCVGARSYAGEGGTIITAWEDEITTPDSVDGYQDGETFSFKYWDASDGEEFDLNVSFAAISSTGGQVDQTFTTSPVFGLKNYAKISFADASPDIEIPETFALHQNYPNPFNPATTIRFDLKEASKVKLIIYNILGQKVITLQDQICSAGYKSVKWDGRSDSGMQVATGLYIYQIQIDGLSTGAKYHKVKKMMMLK